MSVRNKQNDEFYEFSERSSVQFARFRLVHLSSGEVLDFSAHIHVGKRKGSFLCPNDSSLSAHHGAFFLDPMKRPCVMDLASKNGTFINGIEISAKKVQRLQHGDVVVMGAQEFQVEKVQQYRTSRNVQNLSDSIGEITQEINIGKIGARTRAKPLLRIATPLLFLIITVALGSSLLKQEKTLNRSVASSEANHSDWKDEGQRAPSTPYHEAESIPSPESEVEVYEVNHQDPNLEDPQENTDFEPLFNRHLAGEIKNSDANDFDKFCLLAFSTLRCQKAIRECPECLEQLDEDKRNWLKKNIQAMNR